MKNEYIKDLLFSIYIECNGHLKEQSNKLWQVITFATSILSLYFAQELILHISLELRAIISIFVFAITFFLLLYAIKIRGWHMQYVETCKIIASIIAQNRFKEFKSLNAYIESFMHSDVNSENTYKFSSSDYLVFIIELLSVFPIIFLMYDLLTYLNNYILTIIIIAIFIYAVFKYTYIVRMILKNNANIAKTQKNWMIDFS